jgi:hypothetical protein
MFGKSLDLGVKRDAMGAAGFFFAHLVILVGLSSVLVHFLGVAGVVQAGGGFFEGSTVHTMIGSLFTLWLGGMILHKRGMTSDLMSIIVVMIGVYLAWDTSVILGLVPVALLTTMGK